MLLDFGLFVFIAGIAVRIEHRFTKLETKLDMHLGEHYDKKT